MRIQSLMAFILLLAGGMTAEAQYIQQSIAEDQPPERIRPIQNIEAVRTQSNQSLDLSSYFSDPDEPEAVLAYEIIYLSNPDVASVTSNGSILDIEFLDPGQTSVVVKASRNGLSALDTFAIGVRPAIEGYTVSGFEEITLNQESYWNGSDESGGFTSGLALFSNAYNAEWFSWSGWAVSGTTDNFTAGYGNQYSAFSTVRLDSINGKNYAVGYPYPVSEILLDGNANRKVTGFFVTNSTYAALSMKYGDSFSKKFGGTDGTDPDWFNLAVTGYTVEGDSSGTVYFMLADYRFEDHGKDYIVETWQWVDLLPLGDVHKLSFSLSSSDNGDWGMNTPGYFCIDNLYVGNITPVAHEDANLNILIYPNPSVGRFRLTPVSGREFRVSIYDLNGKCIRKEAVLDQDGAIDITDQPPGIYVVRINTGEHTLIKRLVKK